MNLADPNWELIDPTPNVHALFVQFDKTFFWTKLERVVVKWSKRMYSCAGTCTYCPRTRGCIVTLSEPLLKLRPRKDLVETLLHEMIHAYLFITGGDQNRDGHGPMFKSHMHRINQKACLNISIYHDFHDEVRLYKTHWWRCNGPCQQRQPFFGIIKRSSNRAPSPNDFWWEDHRRTCNGTFIKIKEPEKKTKGKESKTLINNNMSKYLTNLTNSQSNILSTPSKTGSHIKNVSNINKSSKGIKTKTNGSATVVITNNINNKVHTIEGTDENKNIVLWKGDGNKINGKSKTNILENKNISETVRNVWANKQINSNNMIINKGNNNKRRITDITQQSPPTKITKIDDFFIKNTSSSTRPSLSLDTATSILEDVYGENFKLYQNGETNSKIIAVQNSNSNIVDCPICNEAVKSNDINRHLDECLNKEEIINITNNKVNLDNTFGVLNSDSFKEVDTDEPKPSTSRKAIEQLPGCDIIDLTVCNVEQRCPCCNQTVTKSLDEHLDECLSFMDDKSTVPDEGNSIIKTEVISDDDYETVDESTIFNQTGTKFPCPCCLVMIEQDEMNNHLDRCLKTN